MPRENDLHVIISTPSGFGWMAAADYATLPEPVKERTVEILAVCPTEAKARTLYSYLPHEWDDDVMIAYRKQDAKR